MFRNESQTTVWPLAQGISDNQGVAWEPNIASACAKRKHVLVSNMRKLGYGCGMAETVDPVVAHNRLVYLEHLRDEMFGGNAAALARGIAKDPNQVREYLAGGRNIGERFARLVERELQLDFGVMDRPLDELEKQDEADLKPDEAALLRKYRIASPDGRVAIQSFAGLSNDDRNKLGEELLKLTFGGSVDNNRMGKEWRNPDSNAANDAGDQSGKAKGKKRKGR